MYEALIPGAAIVYFCRFVGVVWARATRHIGASQVKYPRICIVDEGTGVVPDLVVRMLLFNVGIFDAAKYTLYLRASQSSSKTEYRNRVLA